jgi:hypothetical protein
MDMFKNTHTVGVWYYQCLSFRFSYQEVSNVTAIIQVSVNKAPAEEIPFRLVEKLPLHIKKSCST